MEKLIVGAIEIRLLWRQKKKRLGVLVSMEWERRDGRSYGKITRIVIVSYAVDKTGYLRKKIKKICDHNSIF